MILRFCSGSVTPGQPIEEQIGRVDELERQLQPLEPRAHLRGFVEAQQAVVHEDARQPIADRLVQQHGRDRRVDAARQRRRRRVPSPTGRANPRDALVDERRHRPVAAAAADAEREVAQDVRAALGVHDFGMEQQRRRAAGRDPACAATGAFGRRRRRPSNPARRAPRRSRRGSPRRAATSGKSREQRASGR